MSFKETEETRYTRLAIKVYDELYRERSRNRPFMNPAVIRDMITHGKGKWMASFRKVTKFILAFRDERGGGKGTLQVKRYMEDYFKRLLDYYKRFGRTPTLKQITGPTIEDEFRNWVYQQEDEWGRYFDSQKEIDRRKLADKYPYVYGKKNYDPILPHLWDGPGDPSKVPELNKHSPPLPIHLGFREMVKHRLIDPPQEDIDEYNRLYVEDEDDNRWVGDGIPEPVEKPGPPPRVSTSPEKPIEPPNKYGITRGPLVMGRVPEKAPPRVKPAAPKRVPKRVPGRVEARKVPARAKPVPKRVNKTTTPKRVERV